MAIVEKALFTSFSYIRIESIQKKVFIEKKLCKEDEDGDALLVTKIL